MPKQEIASDKNGFYQVRPPSPEGVYSHAQETLFTGLVYTKKRISVILYSDHNERLDQQQEAVKY